MYRDLSEKQHKKKADDDKVDKVQPKKRDDLEDGEIDVDEDRRRREREKMRREPSEDIRRDYRRDDRHRALYENGDRLSFRRDRDRDRDRDRERDRERGLVDRGRPSWSPNNGSSSLPSHRHSPY